MQNPSDPASVQNQQQEEREIAEGKRPRQPLYEEPAWYIRIKEGLYLICFVEENMNRVDPERGGNNLVLLVNLKEGFDCGRTFSLKRDQKEIDHGLIRSFGELTDEVIPLASEPSPYRV